MTLPRLAPSTNASPASGVTMCAPASDITSSTTATLEYIAQVRSAASTTLSVGSLVSTAKIWRIASACSSGRATSRI